MNKFSSVTWWLAFRTLSSKQNESSFGWVTMISILGLAVGVAALTVTLGILAGFDREYKKIILGLGAHAVVLGQGEMVEVEELRQKISKTEGVQGVHPFIFMEGMVGFRGKVKGAVLKGIDPRLSSSVSDLENYLSSKKPISQLLGNPQHREMVLGRTLANQLGVQVGDFAKLIIIQSNSIPQIYSFQVKDFFYSGMHEFDSRFVYLNLKTMQKIFLNHEGVTGLEISVLRPERIDLMKPKIERLLSFPLYSVTWKELNANLFAALKLERVVFFLVIFPIVVVGALTVIAALIMFIQEKKKEIAILRALGIEKRVLTLVVLVQGVLIAALGISIGLVGGTLINFILAQFPLIHLAPQVYFIDHLPISVRMQDYVLIGVTSLIICLLSTLIPAYQATRLNPVEGIRGY